MGVETITNARFLNEQARARGYSGPDMSSVEALQWLMDNPNGGDVTRSNAQAILGHDQRLNELDSRPTFRGVYADVTSAETNIDPKSLHDGDYILVGPGASQYKLYTRSGGKWELGYRPIVYVESSSASLPTGLGSDDTGTVYYVKQDGGIYVFDSGKWIAATNPVKIDGYVFNLVIH